MNLRDGTKKMSKSDPSDATRINLNDTADSIVSKIRKAKTDAQPYLSYSAESRPEISNLLDIHHALSKEPIDSVCQRLQSASALKEEVSALLVRDIVPLGEKTRKLLTEDRAHLIQVLYQGEERARELAEDTMKEVRQVMGVHRDVQ